MFESLSLVFSSFLGAIFDQNVYRGLIKDLIFTIIVFLVSLFVISILFYVFPIFSYLSGAELTDRLLGVGKSFFIFLLLPIGTALVAYLIRGESRFLSLVERELGPSVASSTIGLSSLFRVIRVSLLLVVFSILGLLPVLGVFFSSFLISFDCLSYSFETKGFGVAKQFSFCLGNLLSIFILGFVVVSISIVPFGFIVSYPIGILTLAKFYKALELKSNASS